MGLAKLQYFFRVLATKAVNELYVAKAAVRIEQILKENNINPRACVFVVTGEEDRDPVVFIIEERMLSVRKLAEIIVPHKLEQNFALLGHALTECGVNLRERIWITGFGIKHLAKDNTKRETVRRVKIQVAYLRQIFKLI